MNRDVCKHFNPINLPCDKCKAAPVEPVAWRWGYRSITTGEMDWRGYVEIAADPNLRSPGIIMQPLYASPPQRKPLSAVDLRALYDQHAACQEEGPETSGWWDFARAIEWAHGIV